jgi:two-component sensor histidine kinase
MIKQRLLLIILILPIFGSNTSYSSKNLNPDTAAKRAKAIYSKSHSLGISFEKHVLQSARFNHDTEIRSLCLLAQFYWTNKNYDTAKIYAKSSLEIAKNSHINELEADSWLILGLIDYSVGNYAPAIENYHQAILYYKEKNDMSGIAKAYLNIGMCLKQQSQYDDAIKYYLLAAVDFENLKDDKNLAITYNSVALLSVLIADYPKAVEYNKKALVIRENLKDDLLIAESLNNIGIVFRQYNKLDSAITYFSASVVLYNKSKDSSVLVLPLQNLGAAWRQKGNYAKSILFITRSLNVAAKYQMKQEIGQGDLNLARLYIAEKQYNKAISVVRGAEQIATELKIPGLLMDTYDVGYGLFVQKGDYKEALSYSNKRNQIKDSLFTVAKNKTINELEIKYQTTEKEKDITFLSAQNKLQTQVVGQKNRFIIALTIAAALLLLLFIIAYNNFRIKNEANRRIQTLMQDLHHRVKNNLQVLSGLFTMQIDSLNDENAKTALRENEARLNAMNLIHNKLYLDNTTTHIEMGDYLTKLVHHIKDAFCSDDIITLRIEIDRIELDADKAVALGLLINELVTNALKYAFDYSGGEIYLSLKKKSDTKLLLTLSDNGIGIIAADKNKEISFGLKLVNLMARQLNATLIVENTRGTAYQMEITV